MRRYGDKNHRGQEKKTKNVWKEGERGGGVGYTKRTPAMVRRDWVETN